MGFAKKMMAKQLQGQMESVVAAMQKKLLMKLDEFDRKLKELEKRVEKNTISQVEKTLETKVVEIVKNELAKKSD